MKLGGEEEKGGVGGCCGGVCGGGIEVVVNNLVVEVGGLVMGLVGGGRN